MVIIAFIKCNVTLAIGCILFVCVVRVFGNYGSPLGVLDLSPKFCGKYLDLCHLLRTNFFVDKSWIK